MKYNRGAEGLRWKKPHRAVVRIDASTSWGVPDRMESDDGYYNSRIRVTKGPK